MNRRNFTKSLAALGLAPALPAMPVAASASTAASGFTPYMYGLGAHLARTHGQCSPAILMQKLRLAPDAAQAMQAQLMRNGILAASNTAGLATAAQPYMRAAPAINAAVAGVEKSARRMARKWIETHHDDPPETDQES